MSATGQYQTASSSIYGGSSLYVSTNFGSTWEEVENTKKYWSSVSVSASGQYQTAVSSNNDKIYISTTTGASMIDYVAGAAGARGNYTISGNNLYVNDGTNWLQFAGTNIGAVLP